MAKFGQGGTRTKKGVPVEEAVYRLDQLQIARAILRYFVTHPTAKDTLEGVARWWLARERIDRTVDEVAQSLSILLARGLIIERHGNAVRPYYQVNGAKRKEITEFLVVDGHTTTRRNPLDEGFRGDS